MKLKRIIPGLFFQKCVLVLLLFVGVLPALAQVRPMRVMFWNVENFYDTEVDSTRDYNAFTPTGEQHWTYSRYITKRNNVFKTITAIGQGDLPHIIGLCEVENERVLRELTNYTPLRQARYRIIHYESPDRRGIDVAMLYRPDYLRLISSRAVPVTDSGDANFKTRDILRATFLVNDADTLHVFVNHWPSRYGGQIESVERRFLAASVLRRQADSIMGSNPDAKILMMGDFNDTPTDLSLVQHLRALPSESLSQPTDLVNLYANSRYLGHEGTLKHQYSWQIFDMIFVSQSLYKPQKRLRYMPGSARIFAADFLLQDDDRYLGKKIFRTYLGPSYLGGFADHLPVYVDLDWIEEL
ncbi:MAG TPA: endonuclease [Bacteroidales bacterium]|nr:endonuclease [Bacteroidales bacterium]